MIKLVALKHKGQLLKDCLQNKKEAPEEWQVSTTPLDSTTSDIKNLQANFNKEWMSKLEQDISANLIPHLKTKIESLVEENKQGITTEIRR